ncbi:trigger factor [Chondromyces crocatus]|uniref:Trigger factor n=1 Tax=Chondromyces crocatus TaxID=52 RepID=A0A0K1EIJ1_CHOCO|nr:trigger factor [Chondromyces crocatus]AKT40675.1 trigger factor [Chondromyces crocatus]
MQVTVEKLSPVLLEFLVEVPADQVRSEVDKAYSLLQRTARVRGFRPGKAPRHVLSHLYGGRVHADVAQRLVDATLNKALAEKEIQPLSQPAIAPTELRPDESFSYKARFEVRPEIAEVKWEGFEVKRPSVKASDEMVDAEVTALRQKHATLQAPDPERPAKKGDVATITFQLEVSGQSMGQKDQEVETEVGSGQLFKEIEEALDGMTPGQHKDVSLTFPAQHQNPELRGKDAVFHITLKDLRERIYPEVDDEFAKDCGEDSLEALRTSLRTKVEKELTQKASDTVAEQLVIEICKANPIPVPPSLVDQQAQLAERELLAAARRQGQRIDPTPELRARVRLDSEMKVRAGLLMAEIAKAKEVKITDADIEKGYEELAEQTGKNVAKVKAEYRDPKKREILIGMILEDKILDMIEAAAKVTEAT